MIFWQVFEYCFDFAEIFESVFLTPRCHCYQLITWSHIGHGTIQLCYCGVIKKLRGVSMIFLFTEKNCWEISSKPISLFISRVQLSFNHEKKQCWKFRKTAKSKENLKNCVNHFDSAVSMTLRGFCICKYLPKIEIIYKNTLAYE